MTAVAVLLPPAVVPPLLSLVAPVVTVTVTAPEVVGVPLTGQEMMRGGDRRRRDGRAGADGDAGGQAGDGALASVALAVAVALLRQKMVPE